ncbi:50S ribosomal protein L18 [Phormidium sp. CCY1219]|jgi:large subunit ribosomal protein L18|uniref:50S ribosomal protein L18 n=1 Tax=Phormidium sp. CCY1219 TaxID=2886104 RepID=UPI002D1EEAAB|nr:50S ribosomal protein L18 [Phormidium sp. CCY1219]MEB3826640.1 50S ribosomal protein L18 [Phormidium sp. CCY1219]
MKLTRKELIHRRHRRVRRKVVGTPERPRLCVFRSNQHIYAQVIDDTQHHTLTSASTVDSELKADISSASTCEASARVGTLLAQRALEKGVQKVVFDRGGHIYHGRVKALADAAREAGLDF